MWDMPARELDARRLKFAAAVAQGKTYSAAYREAGYSANGKPTTVGRSAQKLSQNGRVREAIQKMRQQLLPDPGDVRDLHAHALGVVVELSLHSPDQRVRLQAATWLREETGKLIEERKRLEQAVEPCEAQEQSVLVAELREIYAAALPWKVETGPVAETANEAAVEPQVETSPLKSSGLVEKTDEVGGVEAEAAEPARPQVRYKLRPKPGQFGGRPQ
jgi:hypothetical protein